MDTKLSGLAGQLDRERVCGVVEYYQNTLHNILIEITMRGKKEFCGNEEGHSTLYQMFTCHKMEVIFFSNIMWKLKTVKTTPFLRQNFYI